MNKLSFSKGNAKLSKEILTFSLPAGWTCPGAKDCLSKWSDKHGRLVDGPQTRFRCYAASAEAAYPSVRTSRKRNFDAVRACRTAEEISSLILESLPEAAKIVRVHESGDFFNATYFQGWMQAAAHRPNTIFYAYTKSVKTWIDNRDLVPANFRLTASHGGTHDHLIDRYLLKYSLVVFSVDQANKLGLEIDHDDSHAIYSERPFALLLHNTQPKGSEAAKALRALRAQKLGGYSRKSRKAAVQQPAAA